MPKNVCSNSYNICTKVDENITKHRFYKGLSKNSTRRTLYLATWTKLCQCARMARCVFFFFFYLLEGNLATKNKHDFHYKRLCTYNAYCGHENYPLYHWAQILPLYTVTDDVSLKCKVAAETSQGVDHHQTSSELCSAAGHWQQTTM